MRKAGPQVDQQKSLLPLDKVSISSSGLSLLVW